MILFMRKIRRRLLADSKITKYLIYMIGEIVLIVVGILIALNIENWNNEKITRSTEIAILKEMKKNLKADLLDIRENIKLNKKSLQANELVLKSLSNPSSYIDSLNFYYAHLFLTTILDVNNSSYENLKSFGFQIIENDNLRIKITELYAISYVFLGKMENVIYSIQSDKIIPLVISNITTDTLYVSARPVDPEALAMNHEFKESIKLNREWFRFMVGLYKNTEQEIVELMGQIDNETKNLER
ncbi:MAG: hypothetical protein GXO86_11330 [Chlorobi bacterium]|nr:hypothetical protein [Chlorobiota bacterium]